MGYQQIIYSAPDVGFPTTLDTITLYAKVTYIGLYTGDTTTVGAYYIDQIHFIEAVPDHSWGGTLDCEYDEFGNRTLMNSYCPPNIQYDQPICPSDSFSISGNFQNVMPNSAFPIQSTQKITIYWP